MLRLLTGGLGLLMIERGGLRLRLRLRWGLALRLLLGRLAEQVCEVEARAQEAVDSIGDIGEVSGLAALRVVDSLLSAK